MTEDAMFSSWKWTAISSQKETRKQQEYQSFLERETEQNWHDDAMEEKKKKLRRKIWNTGGNI
jgi:hypothetical protein